MCVLISSWHARTVCVCVFSSHSSNADTRECLLNESRGLKVNERPIWLGVWFTEVDGEEMEGKTGHLYEVRRRHTVIERQLEEKNPKKIGRNQERNVQIAI